MYEYKITKVLKVVDGDTVDVILDLGFDMFKKERGDLLVSIRQKVGQRIQRKKS